MKRLFSVVLMCLLSLPLFSQLEELSIREIDRPMIMPYGGASNGLNFTFGVQDFRVTDRDEILYNLIDPGIDLLYSIVRFDWTFKPQWQWSNPSQFTWSSVDYQHYKSADGVVMLPLKELFYTLSFNFPYFQYFSHNHWTSVCTTLDFRFTGKIKLTERVWNEFSAYTEAALGMTYGHSFEVWYQNGVQLTDNLALINRITELYQLETFYGDDELFQQLNTFKFSNQFRYNIDKRSSVSLNTEIHYLHLPGTTQAGFDFEWGVVFRFQYPGLRYSRMGDEETEEAAVGEQSDEGEGDDETA